MVDLNAEMFKSIEGDITYIERSSVTKTEKQSANAAMDEILSTSILAESHQNEAIEEDQVQFPSVEWKTVQTRRKKSQENAEVLII